MALEVGAERLGDTEPTGRFIDAPHGADRGALDKLNLVEGAEGRQVALELQRQFDGRDLLGIAMGEVGDIALADALTLTVGLAEINRLIDFAIGRGPESVCYIHVHIIRLEYHVVKGNMQTN